MSTDDEKLFHITINNVSRDAIGHIMAALKDNGVVFSMRYSKPRTDVTVTEAEAEAEAPAAPSPTPAEVEAEKKSRQAEAMRQVTEARGLRVMQAILADLKPGQQFAREVIEKALHKRGEDVNMFAMMRGRLLNDGLIEQVDGGVYRRPNPAAAMKLDKASSASPKVAEKDLPTPKALDILHQALAKASPGDEVYRTDLTAAVIAHGMTASAFDVNRKHLIADNWIATIPDRAGVYLRLQRPGEPAPVRTVDDLPKDPAEATTATAETTDPKPEDEAVPERIGNFKKVD